MDIDIPKIKARKIFESTYTDIANIKVYRKSIKNGLTKTILEELYTNLPCKLCFNNSFSTINQDVYGSNDSKIVLMISPDVEIPLNSEITVIKNNREYTFINSNSMILTTHQAVFLRNKEEKA